eukprot:12904622-Prorocentrum_lima.AAC.1
MEDLLLAAVYFLPNCLVPPFYFLLWCFATGSGVDVFSFEASYKGLDGFHMHWSGYDAALLLFSLFLVELAAAA